MIRRTVCLDTVLEKMRAGLTDEEILDDPVCTALKERELAIIRYRVGAEIHAAMPGATGLRQSA